MKLMGRLCSQADRVGSAGILRGSRLIMWISMHVSVFVEYGFAVGLKR